MRVIYTLKGAMKILGCALYIRFALSYQKIWYIKNDEMDEILSRRTEKCIMSLLDDLVIDEILLNSVLLVMDRGANGC
jgi:hypothetical protein